MFAMNLDVETFYVLQLMVNAIVMPGHIEITKWLCRFGTEHDTKYGRIPDAIFEQQKWKPMHEIPFMHAKVM